MQKTKTTRVILLICSLLAIIVLAASLSDLTLKSGVGFHTTNDGMLPDRSFDTFIPEDSGVLIFIQGFLGLVFIVFVVFVVARLIVNTDFKIVGFAALVLVVLVGISYLIPESSLNQTALPGADKPIPTATNSVSGVDSFNGESSPLLFWVLVIIVTSGLGIMIYNFIRLQVKAPEIDAELIRDAKEALDALEAGLGIQNVILHCYFQMTNTLLQEQGIEREAAMTVREFEERLEQKGYPAAPITQLTSLFEKIRYGDQELQAEDEDLAKDSLSEIIQFARNKGEHIQ